MCGLALYDDIHHQSSLGRIPDFARGALRHDQKRDVVSLHESCPQQVARCRTRRRFPRRGQRQGETALRLKSEIVQDRERAPYRGQAAFHVGRAAPVNQTILALRLVLIGPAGRHDVEVPVQMKRRPRFGSVPSDERRTRVAVPVDAVRQESLRRNAECLDLEAGALQVVAQEGRDLRVVLAGRIRCGDGDQLLQQPNDVGSACGNCVGERLSCFVQLGLLLRLAYRKAEVVPGLVVGRRPCYNVLLAGVADDAQRQQ